MALETVTYVNDLVVTNPTSADGIAQGDDHLRNIKTALRNGFLGFTGPIAVAGVAAGTTNTYTLTPATSMPAYKNGMVVLFQPNATNTGSCTLNISGKGAKGIRHANGGNLAANALYTGSFYLLVYDETAGYFILPEQAVRDASVRATTGNGYGSTNTKVRRFSANTTTGSSILYADSAANGGSFTIMENGLYSVQYTDTHSAAAAFRIGISVNSAELTTDIQSLVTTSARVAQTMGPATAGQSAQCFAVLRLATGDVVRAHNGAAIPTGTAADTDFWIRRID